MDLKTELEACLRQVEQQRDTSLLRALIARLDDEQDAGPPPQPELDEADLDAE